MDKDFDTLWYESKRIARQKASPISDNRLDEMINYALQHPAPSDQPAHHSHKSTTTLLHKPWFPAAAAVSLLIIIPLVLLHGGNPDTTQINFAGKNVAFCSNTTCNPTHIVGIVAQYIDRQALPADTCPTVAVASPMATLPLRQVSFR